MNSDGPCFIVFGVPGIGKSTACERYTEAHPEFLYVRASTLLSDARSEEPDVLRRSPVKRVLENQAALVDAFKRFRSGREERPILLDAHAVIDNDADLVEVPLEVISALHPAGLILLEAAPKTILERRREDTKKRPGRTEEQVVRELKAEHEAVARFANSLGVPLQILQSDQQSSIEGAMSALARPGSC